MKNVIIKTKVLDIVKEGDYEEIKIEYETFIGSNFISFGSLTIDNVDGCLKTCNCHRGSCGESVLDTINNLVRNLTLNDASQKLKGLRIEFEMGDD